MAPCLNNALPLAIVTFRFNMTISRLSAGLLALLLLLAATACTEKNKCETLDCQNGGTCEDGYCKCPEGYIGSLCEIKDNPCDRANCGSGTDSCRVDNNVPVCVCQSGYMGPKCDSVWAMQFLGTYTVTETCTKPSGQVETLDYNTLVRGGTKFNSIEIARFRNTSSARLIVDVVQKKALNIAVQPMLFAYPPDTLKAFVAGVGATTNALPEGSFFLSYTLIPLYTTDTTRCEATYIRQ